MGKFHTPVTIYEFLDAKSFADEFEIGKGDVLLTHRFLAESYLEPLELDCGYIFYEDYENGEPSENAVDDIREALKKVGCKRLIAIGGGSILDAAKMLSIKASCTADIYSGAAPLERDMPLVLIPTTCGTGSETSNIAVIYVNSAGTKMGKSGSAFFADASVIIPQFLENLPYDVFMYSALDALIHGIEVYSSPNAHAFSNAFCAEAVRLITRGFKKMQVKGKDARKEDLINFARASSYAGIGLSNNPCGAIHACAMVFGGMHNTPHGMTNAIFMNSILKRYATKYPDGALKEISKIICEELGIQTDVTGAFDTLNNLVMELISLQPLSKFGMKKTSAKEYAEKVLATQQRLLDNSYVELSASELEEVFEELC